MAGCRLHPSIMQKEDTVAAITATARQRRIYLCRRNFIATIQAVDAQREQIQAI